MIAARMTTGAQHALAGTVFGLIYWLGFSLIVAAEEPWDGAFYWSVAYPGSMLIAVALGFVFRQRAWLTGLSLTFAQLPIIVLSTGIGPTSPIAVVFLAILSGPVILAAALTCNIAMIELQDMLQTQQAPLTEEQTTQIRQHPEKAASMLRQAGVQDAVWLDTVLHHHERWDGGGQRPAFRGQGGKFYSRSSRPGHKTRAKG